MNRYQIATTNNPAEALRKWNHARGFIWAETAKSAAYAYRSGLGLRGDVIGQGVAADFLYFAFPDGMRVRAC